MWIPSAKERPANGLIAVLEDTYGYSSPDLRLNEDISRDDVPVSRFALSNFNTFEVGFLNIDITSNRSYQRETQLPLLAL
jgi:hypothetical protein